MIREIHGSSLDKNEKIYIFDLGFATFIKNLGYAEDKKEEVYLILLEGDQNSSTVRSSSCFKIGLSEMARTWFLDTLQVDLHYKPTVGSIHLIYSGEPVVVSYDRKRDFETFKKGDKLHRDWEGNGIQFNVLIDKWLRRLNGEIIPLSDYYHDPYNRWLDSLSDRDD